MIQPKQKSTYSIPTLAFNKLSIMDQEDYFVLDRATICANWYRLWSSFGFNEHQWISRAAKVEEYTRKLLDETLMSYKEQLIKRRQLLGQSLEDYEDLLERIGLSSAIETSIYKGLKLKEQEIYLDDKMQDLLIHEDQLIHRRTELETKQYYLCTLLNAAPIQFNSNLPLSLLRINEKIQDHIKTLSELKDLRHIQVSSYFFKLKEYSEQLEWTPSSPSCTAAYLLQKQFDQCLTIDGLNEIESIIHQLEQQIEQQRTRFVSLQHQLDHLCERLGKERCSRNEHINAFSIKQLEHEIAACRQERMKNGKEYCQSIRQQIKNLLEKARLGDEDRIIVDKLDFEPLTAGLLDIYDAEFERICQLYQQRQPVLDAYNKWLSFWNDFLVFTKASTDPGRFHIRGYNAENEGRKRKKFQRELPLIEQEFLNILSKHDDPPFLIDNESIREKFDQAHQQIPASAVSVKTPSRLLGLTPVRSRTPVATPRRVVNTKEPFVLGTALTSTARRVVKTPGASVGRKLVHQAVIHTEKQAIRAKPRPAPPLLHSSPSHPIVALPVHPPASTGDQSLDFSLLHTMKNIHGQIKVMTSTPNSSLIIEQLRNEDYGKTAHNTIGQRKSKRRSKRTPIPLLMVQDTNDETMVCL